LACEHRKKSVQNGSQSYNDLTYKTIAEETLKVKFSKNDKKRMKSSLL